MVWKEKLELGQSFFDLIKSFTIVAVIVTLLVWPTQIGRFMAALGIEEFEVFGMKGKTSLLDMETQVRDQKTANEMLRTQLSDNAGLLEGMQKERDTLRAQLSKVQPTPSIDLPNALSSEKIQAAIESANTAINSSAAVSQATQMVLSKNAQVIRKHPPKTVAG